MEKQEIKEHDVVAFCGCAMADNIFPGRWYMSILVDSDYTLSYESLIY